MIKFPTITQLYNSYPKPYQKEIPNCDIKLKDGTYLYKNQCAIRLSIALRKCGVSLANYSDIKCAHGDALRARALATFISKQLGPPKILKEGITLFSDRAANGIVYFHKLGGLNEDHIDILYHGATQAESVFGNMWTAMEYWYFKLPE